MRTPLTAALLMTIGLAGCLGEDGVGSNLFSDSGPARLKETEHPMPFGADHDHWDPLQHRFAQNALMLDHHDLQEFGFDEELLIVGAHALDVHRDLLVVAVFGNHDTTSGGQQGFHLFDISDPRNMEHLSYFTTGDPVQGDRTIAFSPDGRTVFLGYEGGPTPGIAAVDVSDPERPMLAHFWSDLCFEGPDQRAGCYGPHTVAAGEIGETTYVFALSFGVTTLSYSAEDGFAEVNKFVMQDDLAVVEGVAAADTTYALRALYAHDTNFYVDPETGTPLLLVAYAYDGMKVLDVSNPLFPVMIASWTPPRDTDHRHYTHSVTAERLETGELIIVVGTETFEDENQPIASPIWILDATAMVAGQPMENPLLHLGTWRNPDSAPSGELTSSVHFFRQQDGIIYLSHYHGGVWVIDARTEAARTHPEHLAYIMPVPDDALTPPEWCCIGFPLSAAPMVFDVAVDDDGYVYSADIVQGVSSIRVMIDG